MNPARAVVWNAFSELYLDTELSQEDLENIARTLAESPYSPDELQHIFAQEVTPICSSNLVSFAGEWLLFDSDMLIPKCKERQEKYPFVENFEKRKESTKRSFFEKLFGKRPFFKHSKLVYRAEEIRDDFTPDSTIADLTISASVEHYPTKICGRKTAIKNQFGCPMIIKGRYHDCRLYLDEAESIAPGEVKKSVNVRFLCSNLVYPKLAIGGIYHLWEGKLIGEVEVNSIEVTRK